MSKNPGDSGQYWHESLNLITGCTRCSEACTNCWALSMLNRFHGQQEGEFRYFPERLEAAKLTTRRKSRRFFVGDLTDLFHEKILAGLQGLNILDGLFWEICLLCHENAHEFILCTKRPANAAKYFHHQEVAGYLEQFPRPFRNIWFLITTENQPRFDERIIHLEQIPAAVRGISAEPLLGPINLGPAAKWLNWVIVGGETGPGARLIHPDWVRSLRDQCQAAGIPFWFKAWGTYWKRYLDPVALKKPRELDGREWNELPEVQNAIASKG